MYYLNNKKELKYINSRLNTLNVMATSLALTAGVEMQQYKGNSEPQKSTLTNKQKKGRTKNKLAKQSRKRNRK